MTDDRPSWSLQSGQREWRQPATTLTWCPEAQAGTLECPRDWTCEGEATTCPICHVGVCTWHLARHGQTKHMPVDTWRTLVRFRPDESERVRRVHVVACWPPSRKNADKPCCYAAATCRGESAACPRCGLRFCEHHADHQTRYVIATWRWMKMLERLKAQRWEIKAGQRRLLRVRWDLSEKAPA